MTFSFDNVAPRGAVGRRKLKSRPDPWGDLGSATVTKDFARATAALVAFAQAKGFAAIGFQCPDCNLKFPTDKALSMHHVHFHQGSDVPHDDSACILDAAARTNPGGDTEGIVIAKSIDGAVGEDVVKRPRKFQCLQCSQKYETENALRMHCRWIHDGETLMNVGYILSYEFDKSQMDKPAQSSNQPVAPEGQSPSATRPLQARPRKDGSRDPRDPFWRDRFRESSWDDQPTGNTDIEVMSRL